MATIGVLGVMQAKKLSAQTDTPLLTLSDKGGLPPRGAPASPGNETTITSSEATPSASETTTQSPLALALGDEDSATGLAGTGSSPTNLPQDASSKDAKDTPTSADTAQASSLAAGKMLRFGSLDGAPLQWKVVHVTGSGLVLLISDKVLAAGAYQSNLSAAAVSDYAASDVRRWLTTAFLPNLKSAADKLGKKPEALFVPVDGDFAFLFSQAELDQYLSQRSDRIAAPLTGSDGTPVASAQALFVTGNAANWWLRADASAKESSTDNHYYAPLVDIYGAVSVDVAAALQTGIRPGIIINTTILDSAQIQELLK